MITVTPTAPATLTAKTDEYRTRSTEEAMTYAMFAAYLNDNWTSSGAAIAQVFKAMWASSLPADNVVTIARAKVLRSYTRSGRRFYEVNY